MVQYIEKIVVPYVECQRDIVGDKSTQVIMDNFKGQTTSTVNSILEAHNIHVCYISPPTLLICFSQWILLSTSRLKIF